MTENLGAIRISCGTKDRLSRAEIWSVNNPFEISETTKCIVTLSGPYDFHKQPQADVKIEIRYGDTIPDGGWWGQTKEIYRTGTVEVSAKLIFEILIKVLGERRYQLDEDELSRLLNAASCAVKPPIMRDIGS